jgi:hypothetical protein
MVLFPGVKRKLFNNRNNDPDPEFLEVIDLTSSSPAPARKRSREPQYISSQSEVQLPSNPFLENAADPFRDESGFDEEFFDGADVLEELHSQDFSNLSQESQVDFDDETGFDQDFDGADVLDELYSNYELYGAYTSKPNLVPVRAAQEDAHQLQACSTPRLLACGTIAARHVLVNASCSVESLTTNMIAMPFRSPTSWASKLGTSQSWWLGNWRLTW